MPRDVIVSAMDASLVRSSLAIITSSSTMATTWSSISVVAMATDAVVSPTAKLAARTAVTNFSDSVAGPNSLNFTFFKTSNHVLENTGYATAEAAHALENKLNLCGLLSFQVGIAKVRRFARDIVKIAKM